MNSLLFLTGWGIHFATVSETAHSNNETIPYNLLPISHILVNQHSIYTDPAPYWNEQVRNNTKVFTVLIAESD